MTLTLLTRTLWTVAVAAALVCAVISLLAGRTPVSGDLFLISLTAMGLGILVDRSRP